MDFTAEKIMANVTNFNIDIASQMKKCKKEAELRMWRATRKAIIATGTQIIIGMPVITGALRGNWQTTIDERSYKKLERQDKSGTEGITELTNTISAMNLSGVAYFTNNLPYAEFIEYGEYEGQHSQGTVRKAVGEFPQKLKKYVAQEGGK